MFQMILNVVRAMFGYTTGVAAPTANRWARVAILAIVVLVFGIPIAMFGLGTADGQNAIPWVAILPMAVILGLLIWQPATLLAFFAPWGIGARVRGALGFAIACGVLLALVAGWVPWDAEGASPLVPWFLVTVVGYAATFVAPNNGFVRGVRRVFFIALVAMIATAGYRGGWVNSAEGLVTKLKSWVTSVSSASADETRFSICYEGHKCLNGLRTGGDGVYTLNLRMTPRHNSPKQYKGDAFFSRVNGLCRGSVKLVSVGNDAGVRWVEEVYPTPCVAFEFQSILTSRSSDGRVDTDTFELKKGG